MGTVVIGSLGHWAMGHWAMGLWPWVLGLRVLGLSVLVHLAISAFWQLVHFSN